MDDIALEDLFSRMQLKIYDGFADPQKVVEVAADWRHVEQRIIKQGLNALGSKLAAFGVLRADHALIAQFAMIIESNNAERGSQIRAASGTPHTPTDDRSSGRPETVHQRSIFRDWMLQNLHDPFPSAMQCRQLSSLVQRLSPDGKTRLGGAWDALAVKNFCSNLRRRSGYYPLLKELFDNDRDRCGEAIKRVMKGITDEERKKESPEKRMIRERIERVRDYVAGKFESTKVGDWLKSVSSLNAGMGCWLMRLVRQVVDQDKISNAQPPPSRRSNSRACKKARVASDSSMASSVSAVSNDLDTDDRYHKIPGHGRTPSTLSPCFTSPSLRSTSGSSSVSAVSDALLRTPGRSVSGSSETSRTSSNGGPSMASSPAETYLEHSYEAQRRLIAPNDQECFQTPQRVDRSQVEHDAASRQHLHRAPHSSIHQHPALVPIGNIHDLDPALAADLGVILPPPAFMHSQHRELDPTIDPMLQEPDQGLHLPLDFDFRPALPHAVDSLALPSKPAWHDPAEPFPAFNFCIPPPATSHHASHGSHIPSIDVHPPCDRPVLSVGYTESPVELTPTTVREQGARLPRKLGKRKEVAETSNETRSASPEPVDERTSDVEAESADVRTPKKSRATSKKAKSKAAKKDKKRKQQVVKVYSPELEAKSRHKGLP